MNVNNHHIATLLDELNFNDLTDEQINEFKIHTINCADCSRAFESAEIRAFLFKENAAAEISVPPFFQAKVLTAWREKQIVQKPLAVFWRWWQASATLVLMMFLTIIGLLAASIIGSNSGTIVNRQQNSNAALYSTETVILNQRPARNLTTEQVFEMLDGDNN